PPRLPILPATTKPGRRGAGAGLALYLFHAQKPSSYDEHANFFEWSARSLFPGWATGSIGGPRLLGGPRPRASIQILKGEPARQLAGDKGSNGVAVITTKANENTQAVIEFNQLVQRSLPPHREEVTTSGELPANMVFYVDGQQVNKATMDEIAPANMLESINILK
nr:hypothetical protein [Tanacetum cinerariifolium]